MKKTKHEIFIIRIKRMIELAENLNNKEGLDADAFCKKHDVSKRTLLRDIEVLKHVYDSDICFDRKRNLFYLNN